MGMDVGKEARKKDMLLAWIKDPSFTSSFWSQSSGITSSMASSERLPWSTCNQVVDMFGEMEAATLLPNLPSRPHPQCKDIIQYQVMVSEDSEKIVVHNKQTVAAQKKVSAAAASQLLGGAIDGHGGDDDVKGINLKILKADEVSNRAKAAPARMALEDKLTAGLENSDSGTGMEKVANLQGMLSSVLPKLDQSSGRAKTSRHKMTGMLAKDFIAVRTATATSVDLMRISQVEQTHTVEQIKKVLVAGCLALKEGEGILRRVLELSK